MKLSTLMPTSILSLAFLATGQVASAAPAGDLEGLKVIGHHFTTSFNNGKRIATVKTPSEGRYLVAKLAVRTPTDESKTFTNDFVLEYFHQDGKEDRSQCTAVCRAKTATLSEADVCAMGNGSWVMLDKNSEYFSLVFFLESDVNSVNISRIGAEPLTYQVGSDRPYSVYITTNQDPSKAKKAEKVIRAGGYQVLDIGTSLSKDAEGVVIHYAKDAEVQAREISQRIMTEMGTVPTVKKMKLVSDNDIVVWIGK